MNKKTLNLITDISQMTIGSDIISISKPLTIKTDFTKLEVEIPIVSYGLNNPESIKVYLRQSEYNKVNDIVSIYVNEDTNYITYFMKNGKIYNYNDKGEFVQCGLHEGVIKGNYKFWFYKYKLKNKLVDKSKFLSFN